MFIKTEDELPPDTYVILYQAHTTFDGIDLGEGTVSLEITEDSDLIILQDGFVIGYFYYDYQFTPGMSAAISDDRFAIMIIKDGPFTQRIQPVKITFFVRREDLIDMLEVGGETPALIQCLSICALKSKPVKIPLAKEIIGALEITAHDNRLYRYQRHNVAWLVGTDNALRGGMIGVSFMKETHPFLELDCGIKIFFGLDSRILLEGDLPAPQMKDCNGLLFCDPVGMGKTACVTRALEILSRDDDRLETLVVVPGKVLKQWKDEFSMIGMSQSTIVCKRSLKKYLTGKRKQIVIMSTHMLKNPAFLLSELRERSWTRVVIDEGHEMSSCVSKSKPERLKRSSFHKVQSLRSGTLWVITATPTGQSVRDFMRMTRWLFDYGRFDDCVEEHAEARYTYPTTSGFYHLAMEQIARRTCEKEIARWVQVPKPEYHDIYVSMTWVEHTLYEGERGCDDRMIAMCSHPVCSKFYQRILMSHDMEDIDSFTKKAMEYLERSIPRLEKSIERTEAVIHEVRGMNECDTRKGKEERADVEAIEKELEKKVEELRACEYRLSVVSELENKAMSEECCVCYGDLEELSLPGCGHALCIPCYQRIQNMHNPCPQCRVPFKDVARISLGKEGDPQIAQRNKWGSKVVKAMDLIEDMLTCPTRRVIVFSRWTNVLKHLKRALKETGVTDKCISLRGSVHHMAAGLARFRHSKDHRVVLLSSQVCSSGVNLTEATDIILFDSLHRDPPAQREIEIQAVGRAVRIGQTKVVQIYRLVAEGTIEEKFTINAQRTI